MPPSSSSSSSSTGSGSSSGGSSSVRSSPPPSSMGVDADDVEIFAEDQSNICRFSCLNCRHQEISEEVLVLQEGLQRLSDATEEVAICLEEKGVWLSIGEAYISAADDAETAECFERSKREKQKLMDSLTAEDIVIQKEMGELKSLLYAKFGKNICLDI